MKPIGLQLYSLREIAKDDLFGVLRGVAETGYKGVETAELYGHEPAEVRKVLGDLGLVVPAVHHPLPTKENINEVIDTLGEIGTRRLIASGDRSKFGSRGAIRSVADQFSDAADLLIPHGFEIGYHNHWWEFERVEGRLGWEILLEALSEVFFELDVYWARNFGAVDVPPLLKAHADRVPILHLKDGPLVEGEPHTAVGAGNMDIAGCVNAANPAVLEWLIVELDACATDMLTAVRDSYSYLTASGLAEGTR